LRAWVTIALAASAEETPGPIGTTPAVAAATATEVTRVRKAVFRTRTFMVGLLV